MIFSSFVFLFAFLPLLFLLYFTVPSKAKNAVLLAFSVVFYAWGEPVGVVILLLSVLIGWIGGLQIERLDRGKGAKIALAVSVSLQVLLLVYFKYIGLLLETFGDLTSIRIPLHTPGLPIGISFFTFHLISYSVDVYRGAAPALSSYSKLLLYISLFPQLVAGPIIRYADIQGQLHHRRISLEGFSRGIFRFTVGMGKKVVIANALTEVTPIFLDGDLGGLSVLGAWFGILLFALQIYFDFSGYSDMAIGLAAMFGFTFKENFDYPYISRSATEFWRRWNMSVGQFFRDYVYIPLGGNRRRPLFNLFAVWFLTGLWHGASWNYVIWGLYFGVLIALEKSFLNRVWDSVPRLFSHFYFIAIVLIGWVFFYFESLPRGAAFLKIMLGLSPAPLANAELWIHVQNQLFILIAAVIAAVPWPARLHERLAVPSEPRLVHGLYASALLPVLCLGLLLLSVLLLVGKTYAPFFYFRF